MRAPDLFERELLERVRAERPEARAARRASERWVTVCRLWAAMDRDGITEAGDRARFICRRLWPDLRPDVVEQVIAHARAAEARGPGWPRPTRARDVVGEVLERWMVEHGYDIGDVATDAPPRPML